MPGALFFSILVGKIWNFQTSGTVDGSKVNRVPFTKRWKWKMDPFGD